MIDKTNMNYHKSLSDDKILREIFSCAYLLQTNQHIEIFKELKNKLLSTYEVIAEFTYKGYNGGCIMCNQQTLVYRKNKFKPIILGKNVEVLNGTFTNVGGSNTYPAVTNQTGFKVTLKFLSYGLPIVDETNGWDIHIISLTKQG